MTIGRMTSRTTTGRKGFTLIELLVVIAIIAILAAVLFPVFAKVRQKAQSVACLSNLKQSNFAVMQYCDDWGYGPSTTWPRIPIDNAGGTREVEHPWMCKLEAYGVPYYLYSPGSTTLSDTGAPVIVNPVFECRSQSSGSYVISGYDLPYNRGGYYVDFRPGAAMPPFDLSQVDNPQNTMLVGEAQMAMKPGYYQGVTGSRGCWTSFMHPKWYNPAWGQPPMTPLNVRYSAHNNGMNVGYCDGHVAWMSQQNFYEKFDALWCVTQWRSS